MWEFEPFSDLRFSSLGLVRLESAHLQKCRANSQQPCCTLLTLASISELRLAISSHLCSQQQHLDLHSTLKSWEFQCRAASPWKEIRLYSGVGSGWGARWIGCSTSATTIQAFVDKVLEGKFPIYESRRPILKKHVAAMVCNVQCGLRLEPVGPFRAWSDAAEQQVLRSLQRPKLVRSKQTAPLALPSPPRATWLHASRKSLIIAVPSSCSLCHPMPWISKVLALKDAPPTAPVSW